MNPLCFSLFFLFITAATAQPPAVQWIEKYGSSLNKYDRALALVVDDLGYSYVTGKVSKVGGSDFGTIKYDPAGTVVWDTTYNGPANGLDESHFIALDDSGNVYACGQSEGSIGNNDYCIIKYNTSGTPQWIVRYNGPGNNSDIPTGLVVKKGNVYVTGYSMDTNLLPNYATIKYNTSGLQAWVRRYQGPLYEARANALAVDDSGYVYVTGEVFFAQPADNQYGTIKYDSIGNTKWLKFYQGLGNGYDAAKSISLSDSGHVYVTGLSNQSISFPDNFDILTIKYSPIGDSIWVKRHDGGGDEEPLQIVVDSFGNSYIISIPFAANSIGYTIKYNAIGDTQWVRPFVVPIFPYGWPSSIGLDKSGNSYVVGSAYNTTTSDIATIKYDNNGLQEWYITYDGLANDGDGGTGIAIDSLGNVYVIGECTDAVPDNTQYVTIKYNQTTGTNEHAVENIISISPNPFIDKARLIIPDKIRLNVRSDIYVYDLFGNMVLSAPIINHHSVINRGNLTAGMYFCRIVGDRTIVVTGKFIIQ